MSPGSEKTPQQLSNAFVLAERDLAFLARPELRPIRLQLELLKPELVMREHGIVSTVVVFGSARVPPPSEADASIARAPEDDDGRDDAVLAHHELGLQQLELEADRAQLRPGGASARRGGSPPIRAGTPRRRSSARSSPPSRRAVTNATTS
jgi:hypothetical protein